MATAVIGSQHEIVISRTISRDLGKRMQHSREVGRHGGVIDATETGDVAAVYRRLRPALLRLANLLTGSEAAAEDVVQDAFIGYARHAERVENPDGYLRTSVVNLSRSAARRSGRGRRLTPDRVTVTNIPEIDETWSALRRLPERQRAAIVLRFYEDLPFDEIGRLLGCPAATARSLTHRGLAALKETLR
jgi:RNA polymerase sigma factor (sigma-70 family)